MPDQSGLEQLRQRIREFAAERDWDRLRTLKDLSMAVGIEAAELQDHFLWIAADEESAVLEEERAGIEEELADVLIYCVAFADRIDADLLETANRKMDANELRFPKPG